jgi:hypothetical protein
MEQRRSIHLKIGTVKIGEGKMREVKLEGKKIGTVSPGKAARSFATDF